MEKKCGIYLITVNCGENNPLYYVGQSVDIKNRWRYHLASLRNGRHMNIVTQRAFDKYGELNFKFEILIECDKSESTEIEQWFLDEMCPYQRCMNISTDAKAPHRGKPLSEKHRLAISIGGRGMKRSDETRSKISAANTGIKNSMYGNNGSKNKRSRPVVAFSLHTDERLYFESACMSIPYGFSQEEISRCCNGKRVSHKGFVWIFADQVDHSELDMIASTSA